MKEPDRGIVTILGTISTYLPRGIAPRAALSLDGYYAAVAVSPEIGFFIVFLLLRQTNVACSGR